MAEQRQRDNQTQQRRDLAATIPLPLLTCPQCHWQGAIIAWTGRWWGPQAASRHCPSCGAPQEDTPGYWDGGEERSVDD